MKTILIVLLVFFKLSAIAFNINEIGEDSVYNKLELQKLEYLLNVAKEHKIKNYDSANLMLLAADNLLDSLNSEDGDVNALIKLGNLYFENGYFESSEDVYQVLLNDYLSELTELQAAEIKHSLGLNYIRFNNYDKSINYIQEALLTYERLNSKKQKAKALKDIGAIYYYLNNENFALDYYQQALIIYRELNDIDGIARSYNNIGMIFKEKSNYSLALEYLNNSLEIKKTQDNQYGIANTYGNIGDVYLDQKNYDKAIHYFNEALEIWLKLDYLIGITEAYNYLGEVYIQKQEYQKAIDNLQKAKQISLEHNFKQRLIVCYELLSNAYYETKDYEKSIENHKIYSQLKDSLFEALTNQRIEEYLIRNENLKAENELIVQDKKIIQQRYQIIIILIVLVSVIILLLLLVRQNKEIRRKTKKIQNINIELDKRVQLKTSELRISQFSIDKAVDSIFWMRKDGSFSYVNNSACSMLGYSQDELLNMSVFDIVSEFSSDLWKEYWQQLKTKGSYVIQLFFKTKMGNEIPVESAFNFQKIEGEELNFVFSRNIAERKLTEEKLKSAKEKAERSDKLKSAFLANMSHEIRTPMNAIIGFINLLGDQDITQDQKEEIIKLAQSSSNELLNIVNDIIDISKIEADELTVNKSLSYVNRLLKDIYKLYKNDIHLKEKENLKLKLTLEPQSDRIAIYTDTNRFKQIMNNLISNALKFTEEGQIDIGYKQFTKGGQKLLRFYVKDTGIGIPEMKQEIVFDRFNHLTDDRNKLYKGTGLGLAISKRLVDLLGGNIGVESEEGIGSVFYFSLPYQILDTPDKEFDIEQNFKKETIFWPNRKILIVEDTPSNYYLIENYLKPTKVQLFWAKSGKEAIEIFKQEEQFDLVLMDIQLPGINGYEATKLIKSYNNKVPVVAQTAYALAGEREYSLKEGCDDYISKPIKKETLIEILDKYFQ